MLSQRRFAGFYLGFRERFFEECGQPRQQGEESTCSAKVCHNHSTIQKQNVKKYIYIYNNKYGTTLSKVFLAFISADLFSK